MRPTLCHLSHWSANMPSWASSTKSITSSVADTLKRSQNQSTLISGDAMVSNMKSCSSVRRSVIRSVLFMSLQYTIWGAVPCYCDTLATVHGRLTSCLHKLLHIVVNSDFKMCCLLFYLTGKLFC